MHSWLETLSSRRDELRLSFNLAGMDPDSEWTPMEAKLRLLVDIEAECDELFLQLHLARMEAHRDLTTLAESFARVAGQTECVGPDVSLEVKEAVTGLSSRLHELARGNHSS